VTPALTMLWPTIVSGVDLKAPDGVNAALVEAARKVVADTRINGRDYHFVSSTLDHLPMLKATGNENAIDWWLSNVEQLVRSTIRDAFHSNPSCTLELVGHCMIAKSGDRIPAHRHASHDFTVVYYPHVDAPIREDRLNDGALCLIDERSWRYLFRNRNHRFRDGSAFRIHPHTGLMACFPGYVLHDTNVYPGPGFRVTLTAQVKLVMEREYA
jgi:hypothetical protein